MFQTAVDSPTSLRSLCSSCSGAFNHDLHQQLDFSPVCPIVAVLELYDITLIIIFTLEKSDNLEQVVVIAEQVKCAISFEFTLKTNMWQRITRVTASCC